MGLQLFIIIIILSGSVMRLSAQEGSSVEWGNSIRYEDFQAKPAPSDRPTLAGVAPGT